jgi:hypothetical protein
MADRFYEHPQMVLVITNLFYAEAPWLYPNSTAMQAKLNWWEVPLQGTSAYEFDRQIGSRLPAGGLADHHQPADG